MNTIAHILVIPALGWLAVEFWDTYDEPILAFTAAMMAFFFLLAAFVAIDTDWNEYWGGDSPLMRRRGRRRGR